MKKPWFATTSISHGAGFLVYGLIYVPLSTRYGLPAFNPASFGTLMICGGIGWAIPSAVSALHRLAAKE